MKIIYKKLIFFSLLIIINNISYAASNQQEASLIMNLDDGLILHKDRANKLRYPASLTKMMTLYLTFEAVREGKLHKNKLLTVSKYAASRPRSNIDLKEAEKISLYDAVMATIVKSANDAAVVLAEAISINELEFAKKMNQKAKLLGMRQTNFQNASGLHHPNQKTTAYDMAKLAQALYKDFSEYYHLFAQTSFTYNGLIYNGHNQVLKNYPGANGLKTGFINASGFNLVTSAKRKGKNLIGVVLGGQTAKIRDLKMTKLLDKYFVTNNVNSKNTFTIKSKPKVIKSKANNSKSLTTANKNQKKQK